MLKWDISCKIFQKQQIFEPRVTPCRGSDVETIDSDSTDCDRCISVIGDPSFFTKILNDLIGKMLTDAFISLYTVSCTEV